MEVEGKQEARGILQQTQEDIADQQRRASDDMRRRIEAVRQELVKETETLAAAIVDKVLERRL
jgi:F0F1-type ATP synthase membrane subunit b/b'